MRSPGSTTAVMEPRSHLTSSFKLTSDSGETSLGHLPLDAVQRRSSLGRLLQLDLDAVGQHGDVSDLVGLAAEAQLLGREGAKNLTLQKFLRD